MLSKPFCSTLAHFKHMIRRKCRVWSCKGDPVMKTSSGVTCLLLMSFLTVAHSQSPERKPLNVYLTTDCSDTVGSNAASAFREKLRASLGYSLAYGSTEGHSGYEIVLTCAAIPGHESRASAISYVFEVLLPDGARYFVQPGVGVVGVDIVNGWAQNLFSQFDNWASSTRKAMSK